MVIVHFILKHSLGAMQALNEAKAEQVKTTACLKMAGWYVLEQAN